MIILYGRIPSKKNSKMAIPIGKRCVLIPQKAYKEWHEISSWKLKGKQSIPTPCKLEIIFYLPDARRTDLTNKTESIMDLLVDNGILPDDNCNEIPELSLIYRGIDRINPRAEITWQPIPKNQSSN